jgi:hypothetical protein
MSGRETTRRPPARWMDLHSFILHPPAAWEGGVRGILLKRKKKKKRERDETGNTFSIL